MTTATRPIRASVVERAAPVQFSDAWFAAGDRQRNEDKAAAFNRADVDRAHVRERQMDLMTRAAS